MIFPLLGNWKREGSPKPNGSERKLGKEIEEAGRKQRLYSGGFLAEAVAMKERKAASRNQLRSGKGKRRIS